jgi:hypothetical protein
MAALSLTIAAIAVVAYQGFVSALLVRSRELSKFQMFAQLAIIWVLPILGAALCHWFFRLHATHEKPRNLGYPKGDTYDGIEKSDAFHNLLP